MEVEEEEEQQQQQQQQKEEEEEEQQQQQWLEQIKRTWKFYVSCTIRPCRPSA